MGTHTVFISVLVTSVDTAMHPQYRKVYITMYITSSERLTLLNRISLGRNVRVVVESIQTYSYHAQFQDN